MLTNKRPQGVGHFLCFDTSPHMSRGGEEVGVTFDQCIILKISASNVLKMFNFFGLGNNIPLTFSSLSTRRKES